MQRERESCGKECVGEGSYADACRVHPLLHVNEVVRRSRGYPLTA